MVSYLNDWKAYWDIMILLFAIINSCSVPLTLSFVFETTQGYKVMDVIIDLLFVIDIVLMFFTSFQNNKGREEWDSFSVARNYMGTKRFAFDIISILGAGPIAA